MKWIDLPPIWLFGALVVTHFLAGQGGAIVVFSPPVFALIGAGIIGVGLVLIGLAAWQMYRHKTTIIPHLEASNLVQTGVFSVSRNPIYLADVLILLGCILRWNAPVALVLVPLLVWVLRVRFIQPEEARLRLRFGAAFDHYARNTRRWF